jgi:hypothetical protein
MGISAKKRGTANRVNKWLVADVGIIRAPAASRVRVSRITLFDSTDLVTLILPSFAYNSNLLK